MLRWTITLACVFCLSNCGGRTAGEWSVGVGSGGSPGLIGGAAATSGCTGDWVLLDAGVTEPNDSGTNPVGCPPSSWPSDRLCYAENLECNYSEPGVISGTCATALRCTQGFWQSSGHCQDGPPCPAEAPTADSFCELEGLSCRYDTGTSGTCFFCDGSCPHIGAGGCSDNHCCFNGGGCWSSWLCAGEQWQAVDSGCIS
jgi:hypothetical protein